MSTPTMADASSFATAGHDTTKDAISGALLALIENPGELEIAQGSRADAHPVEEMIRWTTPVKEFMRTVAEHTEVRGVPIAEGESVYLAYISGNRDEEVFSRSGSTYPVTQQACGVRVRRALLPRRSVGAQTRTVVDGVRRRLQTPADSVLAPLTPSAVLRWVARNPSTAARTQPW